uniref:Uncharacterized protein n=1 Tax=Myoviridae sp. ctxlX31 TaxID=2827293 RepID=A0A8S5R4X4_9CAUD|nr:MAG TPA: hypothetical protein [Myoviridae sp. ctxlX31]
MLFFYNVLHPFQVLSFQYIHIPSFSILSLLSSTLIACLLLP